MDELLELLKSINVIIAHMNEQLELMEEQVKEIDRDIERYKESLQHKHRAAE